MLTNLHLLISLDAVVMKYVSVTIDLSMEIVMIYLTHYIVFFNGHNSRAKAETRALGCTQFYELKSAHTQKRSHELRYDTPDTLGAET